MWLRFCIMFWRIIVTSIRFRVKYLPRECHYIRTWLTSNSVKSEYVRDIYFGQLITDIAKYNNIIVAFQPLDYNLNLKRFRKAEIENPMGTAI